MGRKVEQTHHSPSGVFFPHIEQALNSNEYQGQHTHADPGPPGTQGTVELQDGNNGTVDQNAEQRANHITNPACQQGTTNHHGGNCVQFHPRGITAISREQRNTPDHASQGGTKAAESIHDDLGSADW